MKFGTIMLAGQPCLVMQHGDGGMYPVDRLVAAADVGSAPTMLCLLYTSPSPRDGLLSRMPSSA